MFTHTRRLPCIHYVLRDARSRLVVYNRKGNQLCGVAWRGGHERDGLLNVQPLEPITVVSVVKKGKRQDKRTGFRALMSCHSVLETSSLKEAYNEKRDRQWQSGTHHQRENHRSCFTESRRWLSNSSVPSERRYSASRSGCISHPCRQSAAHTSWRTDTRHVRSLPRHRRLLVPS